MASTRPLELPTVTAPPPLTPTEIPTRDLQAVATGHALYSLDLAADQPTDRRSWRRLSNHPDYDVWAIFWPPGGAIELHDHGGASGVLHVSAGVLTETFLDVTGRPHTRYLPTWSSTPFGPEHIHDVTNTSDSLAVSIHVYAPRLSAMHFFDLVDGVRMHVRTEQATPRPTLAR